MHSTGKRGMLKLAPRLLTSSCMLNKMNIAQLQCNVERKGASPGTFLQSVIDAKVQFPNFALIFEGNELAVHFCGHTVPCGLHFGQQELLQLFLTPFFPNTYAAKVLSPKCNLSEEWLREVLRDFSSSAKLASPCRSSMPHHRSGRCSIQHLQARHSSQAHHGAQQYFLCTLHSRESAAHVCLQ